ncbi:hypothetical protein CDD83_9075 [Cordyceps sp. RAO-2017]|nr:hypothetical protein CDD83_9075 [Cordyceps sp. RAO-2017]
MSGRGAPTRDGSDEFGPEPVAARPPQPDGEKNDGPFFEESEKGTRDEKDFSLWQTRLRALSGLEPLKRIRLRIEQARASERERERLWGTALPVRPDIETSKSGSRDDGDGPSKTKGGVTADPERRPKGATTIRMPPPFSPDLDSKQSGWVAGPAGCPVAGGAAVPCTVAQRMTRMAIWTLPSSASPSV